MNRTKKLWLVSIFSFFLLFISPIQANAQYVDVSNAVKEWIADPLAYIVANQIIKKITAQTVNWINSGFQGQPAYLTEPGQFFLDIADQEAGRFLSQTNMNALCSPFKANVRLALIKSYLQTDSQRYTCTLSKVLNNYDQFTQDFSQGGWDGWFEVTQNNQNNPYGSYLEAQNALSTRIGTQNDKYQKQLNWGKGFLSFEKCAGTEVTTPSTGKKECLGAMETITPGTVIENNLNTILGTGQHRLEAADEVDEIVGALLNQLISRVIGGIGNGLRGLSGTGNSYANQINTDPGSSPSNPNAGNVRGGAPSVNIVGAVETCTTDIDGSVSCVTDPGSVTVTPNPIDVPTQVLPDINIPVDINAPPPPSPGPYPTPYTYPSPGTGYPTPSSGGGGGGVSTSISGFVYKDLNTFACCSGVKDAGESIFAGETVSLLANLNGVYRPLTSTVTNSSGQYTFSPLPGLNAGELYRVEHSVLPNYVRTTDNGSNFPAFSGLATYNFGMFQLLGVPRLTCNLNAGSVIFNGNPAPNQQATMAFEGSVPSHFMSLSSAGTVYVGRSYTTVATSVKIRRISAIGTVSFTFNGPIEYSDDNVNWTSTGLSFAIPTGNNVWQTVDIPDLGAHLYWRILDSLDDGFHQIDELQFYDCL